jgi:hypothetical protein
MAAKPSESRITLRLEAVEVALRVYGYPKDAWAWLTDWAIAFHGLMASPITPAEWKRELGKFASQVVPSDVM